MAQGTLLVDLAGGATLSAGASGSNTLTLTGSSAQINSALSTLQYQGAGGYNGTDNLTVTTTDQGGLSDTDTVTLSVTSANATPTDADETASTAEDTPLNVAAASGLLANASDADGNPLSITGFQVGGSSYTPGQTATLAQGTVKVNADGSYSFTPAPNYSGAVPVLTYTVADGQGGSDTSTLTLSVTPVNDAPLDGDETASTAEDTPLNVAAGSGLLKNASDSDTPLADLRVTSFTDGSTTRNAGQTLSIAGKGDLTVNADGSYNFSPVANYSGPVPAITYTVADGDPASPGTQSNTSTLTLTVTPVNDPPVDTDETASTAEDTPLNVAAASGLLANASDADGNALSITGFQVGGSSYTSGQTATLQGRGLARCVAAATHLEASDAQGVAVGVAGVGQQAAGSGHVQRRVFGGAGGFVGVHRRVVDRRHRQGQGGGVALGAGAGGVAIGHGVGDGGHGPAVVGHRAEVVAAVGVDGQIALAGDAECLARVPGGAAVGEAGHAQVGQRGVAVAGVLEQAAAGGHVQRRVFGGAGGFVTVERGVVDRGDAEREGGGVAAALAVGHGVGEHGHRAAVVGCRCEAVAAVGVDLDRALGQGRGLARCVAAATHLEAGDAQGVAVGVAGVGQQAAGSGHVQRRVFGGAGGFVGVGGRGIGRGDAEGDRVGVGESALVGGGDGEVVGAVVAACTLVLQGGQGRVDLRRAAGEGEGVAARGAGAERGATGQVHQQGALGHRQGGGGDVAVGGRPRSARPPAWHRQPTPCRARC